MPLLTWRMLLFAITVVTDYSHSAHTHTRTHSCTVQKQGEMSELKQFFPPLWEDGVPVEDDPPPDSEADVVRWMRQLRQPTVTRGVSYSVTHLRYAEHVCFVVHR
jgi:hypothetical protein